MIPLDQGRPTAELLTLTQGELKPASTRGLWLAESFAAQDGWLVHDERIRWQDWRARLASEESTGLASRVASPSNP